MSTESLTLARLTGTTEAGTHSGHSCWDVIDDQPPLSRRLQLLGCQWLPDAHHHFQPPPCGPAAIQDLGRNTCWCGLDGSPEECRDGPGDTPERSKFQAAANLQDLVDFASCFQRVQLQLGRA